MTRQQRRPCDERYEGAAAQDVPRRLYADPGLPDRVFRGVARGGGGLVLAVMLLVGGFLLYRAWEALSRAGWSFLTTEAWEPDAGRFGIAAVLVGTVLIALVAVAVAVPLAVGGALYISEYAPPRLRRTLISVVDLMAAVPSVVYGLWGLFFFEGRSSPPPGGSRPTWAGSRSSGWTAPIRPIRSRRRACTPPPRWSRGSSWH